MLYMRLRLKRQRKRRKKLRANWCERIVNDEDTDSDEDTALARVVPRIQKLVRRQLKHHTSYTFSGRPRQVFPLPPMVSPLQELDEYQFITATRFTKGQFSDMLIQLSRLPRTVKTKHRCTCSLELALFILLKRWTAPQTYEQMTWFFRRQRSWLIAVHETILNLVIEEYCALITNMDYRRVLRELDDWSSTLMMHGAGTRDGVFFADGKAKKDCKPGPAGKTARAIALHLGVSADKIQESMYNGYYGFHGEKVQHIIDASGMIYAYGTCLRTPDAKVFEESGMKQQLKFYVNNDLTRPVKTVTDTAYAADDFTVPTKSKSQIAHIPAALRQAVLKLEAKNRRFRFEVEESFNKVVTNFPHTDYFRKHKMFQSGDLNFSKLVGMWYAVVLFTNLHTCYNGSHATGRYGVEPPCAADYVYSCNHDLLPRQ